MDEREHNLGRQTGRIEYIDIFRAFGIILMVMGHIGFGDKFDLFIHAFHMPMFFFVSGFLYKNRKISFAVFLKNKAKSLLIPYFVFAAVHYALNYFIHGAFSTESLKGLIYPDSKQIPIAGALWFLAALFFADIIYYWISKINLKSIQWIVVIVISLTGQFAPARFGIVLPFALGSAFVGVGLMHIGKSLRLFEYQITSIKSYLVLFFGAIVCFSILRSEYVNMRTGVYPYSFLIFWVNAAAASIIGMNIAKIVKSAFKDSIICKYLQGIGRNSIVYVCLNQIVIWSCFKIIARVTPDGNSGGMAILVKGLCLIISLILLFLLSLLFEKTFFRVLIGRFKKKA